MHQKFSAVFVWYASMLFIQVLVGYNFIPLVEQLLYC